MDKITIIFTDDKAIVLYKKKYKDLIDKIIPGEKIFESPYCG
jgi:hypothetical protein